MRLRLLTMTLALAACDRCASKPEAAKPSTPAPAAAAEHPEQAEVELFGEWRPGPVKAARATFVVQAEPCVPRPEKPTVYGQKDLAKPGTIGDEYFITWGAKGHACLYGFDEKGALVGAASYAKNPLTFEGEGEVIFHNVDFVLEPVAGAAPVVPGVLVAGEPDANAWDALATTKAPGPIPAEPGDVVGGVLLTRLEATISPNATVREVNAALDSVGARITTSARATGMVTLAIPRADDAAGVERVVAKLEASGALSMCDAASQPSFK